MPEKKPVGRSDDVTGTEHFTPQNATSHEDIARLAHALWEARAGGDGSADEDWLEAERRLQVQLVKAQVA